MANSTRSALFGRVATFSAYCSAVSTCSSRLASCTSPQVPRVLTLVSTFLRSPTPAASVCISPRPRCTCSSRSETSLKDSPRRCSSVACSFSSTVLRISSSLAAFSVWMAPRRVSTVRRNCSTRASKLCVSRFRCWPKASNCCACSVPSCPTCPASPWPKRSRACACSARSPRAVSCASLRRRPSSPRSSRSCRSSAASSDEKRDSSCASCASGRPRSSATTCSNTASAARKSRR